MSKKDLDSQEALLACFDRPCMLVDSEQVTYANDAAINLLGRHITGANVRLAIRAPVAISAILASESSSVTVTDIGTPGSVWELRCELLSKRQRLVTMQDKSEQQSIARVHTDFVANASHELRTPLANILGYVETLNDPKAGGDPSTRKRFLGTIRGEAERMQSLVSDLMSLSRIEAEKHRLPDNSVNLNDICNKVAEEFSGDAKISRKIPKQPVLVRGEEAQLSQMLRNLIDNAFKYGGADVQVILEMVISGDGWVKVMVTDDGEGIAPEHLPRLTERFYRTDPGRSKAVGGTGLGLSIVKHIVSRHRGRLDIRSETGIGTRISISLPLVES